MSAVQLEAALEELTEVVDDALMATLAGGSPTYLHAASRHLVDAGGKRLRPVLVLLVAEAVDPAGTLERRLPAAVAVELVHTLSLIHDDVIDDDDLRRGVESVHAEWDRPTAIVAGDLLYARAFELVASADLSAETRLDYTRVLARACRRLCEGQALDMRLSSEEELDEATYLRAVEGKTGALFEAAAEIGARVAGGEETDVAAAIGYGRALGTAFQLHDDVLDITRSTEAIGKPAGSDLNGGKPTLVTIHAAGQGIPPVSERSGDLDSYRRDLEAAGSLEYVREEADRYAAEAVSRLDGLPSSSATEHLADIARYAVDRTR